MKVFHSFDEMALPKDNIAAVRNRYINDQGV
jgi:hypothetical protein